MTRVSIRLVSLLLLMVCSAIVCAGPKVVPHPKAGVVKVRDENFIVVYEFKTPQSIKLVQGIFLRAKKIGDTKAHFQNATHKMDFSDRWLIDINSGEIRVLSKAMVPVYRIEAGDLAELKGLISK